MCECAAAARATQRHEAQSTHVHVAPSAAAAVAVAKIPPAAAMAAAAQGSCLLHQRLLWKRVDVHDVQTGVLVCAQQHVGAGDPLELMVHNARALLVRVDLPCGCAARRRVWEEGERK
eukprot:355487-Chlamydomonas_euryale.AAC.1